MTYLISHHDLAPGFAPRKCCCSGEVYVVSSDGNFSSPFNFNCMIMGLWVYV
ncbi:hypothetical protein glysoja_004011 [Glycine soja]|nr:hypothetical protein glysoja_004011 [Glycine soja]